MSNPLMINRIFNCPYCERMHHDINGTYGIRAFKNDSKLLSITCDCNKKFSMTYNSKGEAVSMETVKIIKHKRKRGFVRVDFETKQKIMEMFLRVDLYEDETIIDNSTPHISKTLGLSISLINSVIEEHYQLRKNINKIEVEYEVIK